MTNKRKQSEVGETLPPVTKPRPYQDSISAPKDTIDWQLALSNPHSNIAKEYWALLINKNIDEVELIHFQEHLAFIHMVHQQRVKDDMLRQMKHDDERTAKMWQAWAAAETKQISSTTLPEKTLGLLAEIDALLKDAAIVTLALTGLLAQQRQSHQQWQTHYHHRVKQQVKQLANVSLVGPDNRPIVMDDARKEKMRAALMPLAPELVFKMVPSLAEKVVDEKGEPDPIVCEQIPIVHGALSELRLLASMGDTDEPLTGPALLAVMAANKLAMKEKGIQFVSACDHALGDLSQEAKMVFTEAKLKMAIDDKASQLANIEKTVKEKVRECYKQLANPMAHDSAQKQHYHPPTPFDISSGPKFAGKAPNKNKP